MKPKLDEAITALDQLIEDFGGFAGNPVQSAGEARIPGLCAMPTIQSGGACR